MYSINLTKLKSLALQSKYTKWYINIVLNAINRFAVNPNVKIEQNRRIAQKLLGKIDGHHIIPRSIDPSLADDIFNVVFLTKREHILMHRLLTKMLSGTNKDKMLFAYRRIIRRNKVTLTSKQAAELYAAIKPANLGKIYITDGVNTKYISKFSNIPKGWIKGTGSKYKNKRQDSNNALHRKKYKITNIIENTEVVINDLVAWANEIRIPYTTLTSAERNGNVVRKTYVLQKLLSTVV